MDREPTRKYNNGRRYTFATKQKARRLRARGLTFVQIVGILGIARGTAHIWTRDIRLIAEQLANIKANRENKRRNNKHVYTLAERAAMGKRLAPYRKEYSKKDLLARITRFYRQNGRIPLKRDFNSHRSYRIRFGSWNKAIIAAGFEPNPELFAKRVVAHDGHVCDSFAEKIIDDWLSDHKILHTRNVPYSGSKMTADFFIASKNVFIEFFGLKGVNTKYNTNLQRKLKIIRRQKLKVITLFPEDLLKETFSRKLEKHLIQRVGR